MSSNKTLLAELVYQESVGVSRINWCISWCVKGGLTMEQAIAGRSKIRNVCIAEVFSRMGIIEQWGTGIQRMIQGCREYGVREPEFIDMGEAFRVNFYRSGTETGIENSKTGTEINQMSFLNTLSETERTILENDYIQCSANSL